MYKINFCHSVVSIPCAEGRRRPFQSVYRHAGTSELEKNLVTTGKILLLPSGQTFLMEQ